jgi:hypothetical protein
VAFHERTPRPPDPVPRRMRSGGQASTCAKNGLAERSLDNCRFHPFWEIAATIPKAMRSFLVRLRKPSSTSIAPYHTFPPVTPLSEARQQVKGEQERNREISERVIEATTRANVLAEQVKKNEKRGA